METVDFFFSSIIILKIKVDEAVRLKLANCLLLSPNMRRNRVHSSGLRVIQAPAK